LIKGTKHIDQEVIQQDLTYNISHILTELSLALTPAQITREEILETIDNYNQDNGSKITLDHLMNIGWLRLINEAYLIPGAINSLMWYLDTKDKDEKNRIPKGMEAEAKVLLEILKRMNALKKSAIDPITVKRIIKAITPSIDTAFLFDKKIISSNAKGKLYYLQSNNYSGQLKERIISLAFIKLFPEEVDLPGFRKFINLIHFIGQWPDRLEDYLPYETIQRIKHLCWEILTTDSDLSYPERELRNDQLDAASYRHKSLDIEVPDYVTTQLDPYGFLLEMRHYRFYDHELFSHHESRYTYTLLIRLLIQFDKNQEQPFSMVKELLKTHQNPFIKYQLLYEIIEHFPIVLPYFMDDPELAPLFFDSIGRLKVDKTWLNEGEGIQVNGPAASKIKNILWIEAMAIDQPIDFSVPESTVMLAVYLSIPEAENERRGLNTANGIRRAKQMGRYPNKAPLGYINLTGLDGRKYIAPKQPEASILKWVFHQIAKNAHRVEDVRRMANTKGLKCSKTNFWRLIRNPVYCGFLRLTSESGGAIDRGSS